MPKLGTLLVRAGEITTHQLEETLRAQVFWGARLGTNLVELGFCRLDTVARYLGRQAQLPGVLERSFKFLDMELAKRLPAEIAHQLKVVPLGVLVGPTRKIAIAAQEPLPKNRLAAVAFALEVDVDDIVLGVTAELRIHYQLERVYGIERDPRFLRVRTASVAPPAKVPEIADDFETNSDIDIKIGDTVPPPMASQPSAAEPASDDADVPAFELTASDGRVAEPARESPSERRRFVRMITEEPRPQGEALGRIQVAKRRVSVEEAAPLPPSFDEALRSIRRASSRDVVGERAVRALGAFGGDNLTSSCILVVRGLLAMSWKGEVASEGIAIPLGEPSLLSAACTGVTGSVRTSDGRLSEIDRRLLAATGGAEAEYAVVSPIAIRDHTICFIFGHGRGDQAAAESLIQAVASSLGVALVRLVRAAQR